MSLEDAISLAIAAINLKSDEKDVKHIKMSTIKSNTKLLERVPSTELEKYVHATKNKSTKQE
jgi:hypothetical protein